MLTARQAFAVVTYNNQIYAIAGETALTVTSTVERFDPATNAWSSLAPKPVAVADVSAAVIGGKLYVPGGRLVSGEITSTLEVYDPETNHWQTRAPLPMALSAYALAAFEGQLYLFGGWNGTTYQSVVYVYQPNEDEWSEHAAMPTARGEAGAVVVAGQIYVMGGTDGQKPLVTNEVYNPSGNLTWQTQISLPVGRSQMGIATLADNIYLVGGEGDTTPSITLQFSPSKNEWQAFEAPPDVKQWSQLGLAVVGGEMLYAFGGVTSGNLTTQNLSYQAIYTVVFPFIE